MAAGAAQLLVTVTGITALPSKSPSSTVTVEGLMETAVHPACALSSLIMHSVVAERRMLSVSPAERFSCLLTGGPSARGGGPAPRRSGPDYCGPRKPARVRPRHRHQTLTRTSNVTGGLALQHTPMLVPSWRTLYLYRENWL